MTVRLSPRVLILLAIPLVSLGWSTPARADLLYHVTVDTTSLNTTTRSLDLELNPLNVSARALTAEITNITGATFGFASTTGDVSGAFPGTVTIHNTDPVNQLLQDVL